MAHDPLREKLDRLRRLSHSERLAEAGTVGPSLPEATHLVEPADDLPLKARLERLVAAAMRGRSARSVPMAPPEELLDGRRVMNARGEFLLVERDVPLDTFHGGIPFSRLRALLPGTVGVLTGERALSTFDLSSAVFLDTETTGLSGGTGTVAFLVGIGFVEGDRFRVRQYFMRDYDEEAALLDELARDLAPFSGLVTYNGKMFDVPLLDTRYRLNRGRFPLAETPHLDLLHPARRLWKLRLESCRLQALETALLGMRRQGDIPGSEMARVYFDYVRNRETRMLPRLLEHNRIDIVSLAALTVLACQWVEEGRAEDPRDVLSLARVLERAQLYERSEAEYRRVLDGGAGSARTASLLRLADRAKRTGDHAEALALWAEAANAGELAALREIAVHHEHRSGDLGSALRAAERGLALVRSRNSGSGRVAGDFEKRRARILARLDRSAASRAT